MTISDVPPVCVVPLPPKVLAGDEPVSTEGVGKAEYFRVAAPNGYLAILLPDESVLALDGQLVRVLERSEFGWKVRPEPWAFGPDAYPNAWWLDGSYFEVSDGKKR